MIALTIAECVSKIIQKIASFAEVVTETSSIFGSPCTQIDSVADSNYKMAHHYQYVNIGLHSTHEMIIIY